MKQSIHLVVGLVVGSIVTGGVGAAPSPSVQDPVVVSPHLYKVLLDNDKVRVLEYRIKAGEKEARHSHPPGIVYALTDTKVRATLADGKTTETALPAGSVIWRESITHSIENISEHEVRGLAIELK